MSNTYVVTGSASGMGAATKQRLEADGHEVIGVDVRDATATFDLGTEHGRTNAIEAVFQYADGAIDGIVTFAGLAGTSTRPGSTVASVNYFGTICLLEGLQPALEAANVNPTTVDALTGSSGRPPKRCLDHLARIQETGHVVDERGGDVYLPGLDRLRFPVAFLGGSSDRDSEGTRRTFEALRRQNGGRLNARQLIRGYGADDCLVGDGAAADVFPWVLHHVR